MARLADSSGGASPGTIAYGFPATLFLTELLISLGVVGLGLRVRGGWGWVVVGFGVLMPIYALYLRFTGAKALAMDEDGVEFWRLCRPRVRLRWTDVRDITLTPAGRTVPYPRIFFEVDGRSAAYYVGGTIIDAGIDEAYRQMRSRWEAATST